MVVLQPRTESGATAAAATRPYNMCTATARVQRSLELGVQSCCSLGEEVGLCQAGVAGHGAGQHAQQHQVGALELIQQVFSNYCHPVQRVGGEAQELK